MRLVAGATVLYLSLMVSLSGPKCATAVFAVTATPLATRATPITCRYCWRTLVSLACPRRGALGRTGDLKGFSVYAQRCRAVPYTAISAFVPSLGDICNAVDCLLVLYW